MSKSPDFRTQVEKRMKDWRFWKSYHTWCYVTLGTCSSAVATVVAANSHYKIICEKYAWIPAAVAAVLTFVISAVGAQAEAKAFETGARLVESALAKYDSDSTFDDVELGKALATAIETLNRKS